MKYRILSKNVEKNVNGILCFKEKIAYIVVQFSSPVLTYIIDALLHTLCTSVLHGHLIMINCTAKTLLECYIQLRLRIIILKHVTMT